MSQLRFEWDTDKAAANLKKHKVSFDEAQTSFLDEDALVIQDPDHSDAEDRFILLGLGARRSGCSSSAIASARVDR